MHGGIETDGGIKTHASRTFLGSEQAIAIHDANGVLGGMHFELTGDNVTECRRCCGLSDADLAIPAVTGRSGLNYEQSLEMAILVAEKIGG